MKFHHLGIACEDIDDLAEFLIEGMGATKLSDKVYDPRQDASLQMFALEDGSRIEAISGNIVKNIVKKKNYLYHSCFLVDNIEESIERLFQNGAILISPPKEAVLFNNARVAFLYTKLGLNALRLARRGWLRP